MKKIMVVMLGVMLLAAPALAANDVTSTSGTLTIGGGAKADGTGNTAEMPIGLSPKVVARYVTNGTNEVTAQWYSIGTVHPGGNIGYATAQDVNNIYMKFFPTGDDTVTITGAIQESKIDTTGLEGDALAAAIAATWAGQGWVTTTPTAAQ